MSVALKMKQSLAQAERISVSTFARKAKTGRNSVRRILDSRNTSVTLKSIGRAAEATADFCTDRLRGWNVRSARFLLSAQN